MASYLCWAAAGYYQALGSERQITAFWKELSCFGVVFFFKPAVAVRLLGIDRSHPT